MHAVLSALLLLFVASASSFGLVKPSPALRPVVFDIINDDASVRRPSWRRRTHLSAAKGGAGAVSRRRRRRRKGGSAAVSARRSRRGRKQLGFQFGVGKLGVSAGEDDSSCSSTACSRDRGGDDGGDDISGARSAVGAGPVVVRMASFEAASLIRCSSSSPSPSLLSSSTSAGSEERGSEERGGFLLITTDASGGSGRFAGTCAVLRLCSSGYVGGGAAVTAVERSSCGPRDAVIVAARRTRCSLRSTTSGGLPPEVAAIALGAKTALKEVSPEDRRTILFATDCERAVSFFVGRGGATTVSSPSSSLQSAAAAQEASCRRAMEALAADVTSGRICICKVRSTSRSGMDGFFDHSAADILSAAVRNTPNGNVDGESRCAVVVSSSSVPPLRGADLQWLQTSEDMSWGAMPQKGRRKIRGVSGIVEREEGRERLRRCWDRIRDEFGMDAPFL